MKLFNFFVAALGVVLANASFAADLQVHLRGEVTSITANEIVVTARNGSRTTVAFPEQAGVLDVSRAGLIDVKEHSYLGIAAAPAADGKVLALGVMVFPEGARGLNEGHFPWDTAPRGTMTNATVAKLAKKKGATELEMRFGERTQAVLLDSKTVFAQFIPGKRDLIAVKSKVMIIATQTDDGVPVAQFVMVGRDGFLPPL